MHEIDAALRSLEDSLDRLGSRLRGTEGETLQLFRARLMLDDTQAAIAAARANGAIGTDWGAGSVADVNTAAMLVAAVTSDGGPPFQTAMEAVETVLTAIRGALP
jgi:hypothetical protein